MCSGVYNTLHVDITFQHGVWFDRSNLAFISRRAHLRMCSEYVLSKSYFTLACSLFDSSLGCRYWSYRYCIVSTSWDVLVYILHVSCFTLLWVDVHVVSCCLRVVRLVRSAPKQFSYVCFNVFAAGCFVRSQSSFQIHQRSYHRF